MFSSQLVRTSTGAAVFAAADVSTTFGHTEAGAAKDGDGASAGDKRPRADDDDARPGDADRSRRSTSAGGESDADAAFRALDALSTCTAAANGALGEDARDTVLALAAALGARGVLARVLKTAVTAPTAPLAPRLGSDGDAVRIFVGAELEVFIVRLGAGTCTPKFALSDAHFVTVVTGAAEYVAIDLLPVGGVGTGALSVGGGGSRSDFLAVAPWSEGGGAGAAASAGGALATTPRAPPSLSHVQTLFPGSVSVLDGSGGRRLLTRVALNEATRSSLRVGRAAFTAAGAISTFRAHGAVLLLHVTARGSDAATAGTEFFSSRAPPAPRTAAAEVTHAALDDTAVSRMLAVLAVPPRNPALANLFAAALQSTFADLSALVASRPRQNLVADDVGAAEAAALAIAHMAAAGRSIDERAVVEDIRNDELLVLRRVTLWSSASIVARLHLFPDASETYVHNHSGNFTSTCFAGSYNHLTWAIGASGTGAHSARTRRPDGELVPVVGGVAHTAALDVDGVFTHEPGNTYFINNATYHTVSLRRAATATLTLVIKDRMAGGAPTLVLVPESAPRARAHTDAWVKARAAGAVGRSTEVELLGTEKRSVLASIERLLCEYAATRAGAAY